MLQPYTEPHITNSDSKETTQKQVVHYYLDSNIIQLLQQHSFSDLPPKDLHDWLKATRTVVTSKPPLSLLTAEHARIYLQFRAGLVLTTRLQQPCSFARPAGSAPGADKHHCSSPCDAQPVSFLHYATCPIARAISPYGYSQVHNQMINALVDLLRGIGYKNVSRNYESTATARCTRDIESPHVDITFDVQGVRHYIDISGITATTSKGVEAEASKRTREKHVRYDESLEKMGVDPSKLFHVWTWDSLGSCPTRSAALVSTWLSTAPNCDLAKVSRFYSRVHSLIATAVASSITKTTRNYALGLT